MARRRRNPHYAIGGDRKKSPERREFRFMTWAEGTILYPGQRVWFVANDGAARQVTVNGHPKLWKRTPGRIEVPVKYGMYEFGRFEERDFEGGTAPRVLVEV